MFLTIQINLLGLTHSAGITWKIANKRQAKNSTLNGYISKTRSNSESTKIFWNFIQISSKQLCFLITIPTWVHGRGLSPLQPLVSLSAACRFQRVYDEPVKVLHLLFPVYFFFFFFGNKQKLSKNCNFLLSGKSNAFTSKKPNFKRLYLKN